jgi:sec-independent protein translocase protein TatA
LSITHILIVLLVILILFGSKKIPEFMKGIGKGIHEFKKATNNLHGDDSNPADEDDKKSTNKKS